MTITDDASHTTAARSGYSPAEARALSSVFLRDLQTTLRKNLSLSDDREFLAFASQSALDSAVLDLASVNVTFRQAQDDLKAARKGFSTAKKAHEAATEKVQRAEAVRSVFKALAAGS